MGNPLAFTPLEVALGVSALIGVAIAVYLMRGAALAHFEWLPAIITAVLAVAVPFVGPVMALWICWNLGRVRRRTQQTELAQST